MSYIKQLDQFTREDLELAGGKGANLGELLRAGLPVPPGFGITTHAYRRFVAANALQPRILKRLEGIHADRIDELEAASADIGSLFEAGSIPEEIVQEIRAACAALLQNDPSAALAVRSSATAEDLPTLSFAGQQDTCLNIAGLDEVLRAVLRCWASLWTARAIAYRARNGIGQDEVNLAVVVQRMIPSEASGVMFTANPLTGKRNETVIDATLGLGEALVSGMVDPDHYVVDDSLHIVSRKLGAKALSVRGTQGGGTHTVPESASHLQALPDDQIIALARLGAAAAQHFGAPQDLEWAWAEGKLYILQSRPITSLYPLPDETSVQKPEVLFSFASWQGMLDPISPLGRDMFAVLVSGVGSHFGVQTSLRHQRIFLAAGERLYVNITGLVRNPTGRTILDVFTTAIDPPTARLLQGLYSDPRFQLNHQPMSLGLRLRILGGLAPIARGVLFNLLQPRRGRDMLSRGIEEVTAQVKKDCAAVQDLAALVQVLEGLPHHVPAVLMFTLLPGIISGQMPHQILLRLAESLPGGAKAGMELTRGLPYNVTTEMDLALWRVSRCIHANAAAREHCLNHNPSELAAQYLAGCLPPPAQDALAGFLRIYGMRGVAEIDLLRPRWREDPLQVMQALQSYLRIDPSASPEAIFHSGAELAKQAADELVAITRQTRLGWLKAHLARFLIERMRQLAGLRETPKFAIVSIFGEVRQALLVAGQQLAADGVLPKREDIFFLHLWELAQLAAGHLPEAHRLVSERRQNYNRELTRRRVPRILLSDGTTWYDCAAPADDTDRATLRGSPVSAGVVQGRVRVVRDPGEANLAPGEILVCPATDPAWTPLFLAAGGLVMEVGGMMTHGSVVAREYGIPAVVGVSQATNRLQTGQRVRVDGSTGVVQVLEERAK